jgi:SOS response regulatory protein OraA/RecX
MSGFVKMPKMKGLKAKKQKKQKEKVEEPIEQETEAGMIDDNKSVDEIINDIIDKKHTIKEVKADLKSLVLDLKELEELLYSKVGEN